MRQLPLQCEASYFPGFLSPVQADALLDELLRNYEITDKRCRMADGSYFEMENGAFIFADAELTSYDTFPEAWGGRAVWPESLSVIRGRLNDLFGVRFQVARALYYEDGSKGVAFHSDPPAYGPTDAIASISLGAERAFAFRGTAEPRDEYRLTLEHGSLLFMGAECQERYEHSLPTCDDCDQPRINLTFRKYARN